MVRNVGFVSQFFFSIRRFLEHIKRGLIWLPKGSLFNSYLLEKFTEMHFDTRIFVRVRFLSWKRNSPYFIDSIHEYDCEEMPRKIIASIYSILHSIQLIRANNFVFFLFLMNFSSVHCKCDKYVCIPLKHSISTEGENLPSIPLKKITFQLNSCRHVRHLCIYRIKQHMKEMKAVKRFHLMYST